MWGWGPGDLDRLAKFLSERDLVTGEITARPIGDGHSNLTFLIRDGQHQVVVRRGPPPPVPPGAHDMKREAHILAALGQTEVPVARVLAVGEADEVFDVPFYVMTFVPGPVITTRTPYEPGDRRSRRALGEALIDTLAALHAVKWQAVGLSDIGKPEGFNGRHVRRLANLLTHNRDRLPDAFEDIHEWLVDNAPEESGAAIVHNDYRIGNVVLSPNEPRVAAVLDWELATVGDPLFDLGYFLASVPEPAGHPTPTTELSTAMLEDGFPTRDELVARYASQTGSDVSQLAWHTTLAQWKLAVLYDYSRRRTLSGGGDPYYADPTFVPAFLTAARRAAGLLPRLMKETP